jgi:hypothetical protein
MAKLHDENIEDDHPTVRDPRANPFGFFWYSDAPAPLGGGMGVFCWFSNAQEAVDWLFAELADHWLRRLREGTSTLDAIHNALEEAISGKRETGDVLVSINEMLKRAVQIEWWGTFEELRTSDLAFPKKVRAALHREGPTEDSEDDESPITESELDAFVEMLRGYGF